MEPTRQYGVGLERAADGSLRLLLQIGTAVQLLEDDPAWSELTPARASALLSDHPYVLDKRVRRRGLRERRWWLLDAERLLR